MVIESEILQCVYFIGYRDAGKGMAFQVCGTGFMVVDDRKGGDAHPMYWVTARHVIDGISRKGPYECYFRLNLKDGLGSILAGDNDKSKGKEYAWNPVDLKEWFLSKKKPDVDIAIMRGASAPLNVYDHKPFRLSNIASENVFNDLEVTLGEEVFISGLFRHHVGDMRNAPIVRIGNLASMVEERVKSKFGSGYVNAYLIESRSIGGISGSPVFLNLGRTRLINGELRIFREKFSNIYLLGLIHGHFDVNDFDVDSGISESEVDNSGGARPFNVNSGIAVVTPGHDLIDIIDEFEEQNLSNQTDQ